ncbi:unnamed protein product [Peronospora belbahrii]|uniref:Histone chaperone n=1 Tax=Peronospora belbahrii TaxID=622444 RepID=A0AAU9LCV9_9STRA|nr:unnamed protein product [Peronospora belbahrii]CAH0520870.1 unnamed protein product [Peronospora belbahrii]
MAYVTLTNITVLDNPTAFTNPFQFEVTFECAQQLETDLEWKITYVGSAEDESRDQVLEEVLVGPVPVGTNKFVFQSDPPNPDMIPDEDKVGVTVALVTCSYRGREFVRVGYYVNNDYADPFLLENPPARVDISKLQRNILADKPRVTRFPIDWSPAGAQGPNAMEDTNHQDVAAIGFGAMQAGACGASIAGTNLEMDFVDDEELVKAAAQLDHNYTDIVIGGNAGDDMEEDIDLDEEDDEDDEADSVEEAEEEDADGDMEMEDIEQQ